VSVTRVYLRTKSQPPYPNLTRRARPTRRSPASRPCGGSGDTDFQCKTENGESGVTLAEVSRFIGPGLNGDISERSP
jgi:hypothetical protein